MTVAPRRRASKRPSARRPAKVGAARGLPCGTVARSDEVLERDRRTATMRRQKAPAPRRPAKVGAARGLPCGIRREKRRSIRTRPSYRDDAPAKGPSARRPARVGAARGLPCGNRREKRRSFRTRPSYTGITRASQAREAGSTPVGRLPSKSLLDLDLCFNRKNGEAPYLSKVTRKVTLRVVRGKGAHSIFAFYKSF